MLKTRQPELKYYHSLKNKALFCDLVAFKKSLNPAKRREPSLQRKIQLIRTKPIKDFGGEPMKDSTNDFLVIKAEEDGVNVIGLTRGSDTRFHHSEKLDKGEVMIAQFTEHTSAIKIRGKAIIQTSYGEMESDSRR